MFYEEHEHFLVTDLRVVLDLCNNRASKQEHFEGKLFIANRLVQSKVFTQGRIMDDSLKNYAGRFKRSFCCCGRKGNLL